MLSKSKNMHATFKKYKARLKKLDTPHFCDVSEKIKILNNQIRPITSGLKMVGVAHTVASKGDLLAVLRALKEAVPDEVLVVDAEGSTFALAGEFIAMEAKRKNIAGIVIDGACRDVDMLPKIKLPFYAKFISPKVGARKILGKTQVSIVCGEVTVSAGDIVIGDDDGVIIIDPQDLEEIVSLAEQRRENEKVAFKKMKKGVSFLDMLNFEEHCRKVERGEQSTLTFNPHAK